MYSPIGNVATFVYTLVSVASIDWWALIPRSLAHALANIRLMLARQVPVKNLLPHKLLPHRKKLLVQNIKLKIEDWAITNKEIYVGMQFWHCLRPSPHLSNNMSNAVSLYSRALSSKIRAEWVKFYDVWRNAQWTFQVSLLYSNAHVVWKVAMLRALCETLKIKRAIIFYSFAIQFFVINAIHILLNNLRCFIQRLPGPYVLSGGPLIFTFSFFS